MTAKLTALMDKNPTAAMRAGEAIERECGAVTTLKSTFEDANEAIAAMSNGTRADAASVVATAKAEWAAIVPTLTPVRLAQLRAEVGPEAVMLLCRYKQLEAARARNAAGR
jgi:hypothetical protein